MMLFEVGEANIAINADAEMAGELITGGRLQSKGEGFALIQIVQGRTGICIHVIGVIISAEREHWAETKSKVPLTDTCMVSNKEGDIEEGEGIVVITIEVFVKSSFNH